MTKKEVKKSLPGHDAARGASKERILVKFDNWCEESEKFRWTTKKGRQKFCESNTKYLLGHPRTSLAPGIQKPLHATVSILRGQNVFSLKMERND